VAAPRPPAGPQDTDAHLREDEVSSEKVFHGRLLEVRRDHVRLPDGSTATREYVVHPGAVMVVPLLDDGRLVMERQWRYPLHRAMLEFPAGKLERGEAPFSCAVRELQEETGYLAREWARAGLLHNAIAYSTEGIEVWFARGITLGERQLDEGEFLDVQLVAVPDLDRLCAEGSVTDAKTLVGLLWLQNWQSGRWRIEWRPAP
jgi:ADP-ribose pyrophosphatase